MQFANATESMAIKAYHESVVSDMKSPHIVWTLFSLTGFSFRGSHFLSRRRRHWKLWSMGKHEEWVDKHKSLQNPFIWRTILIAVLLTIIERQFIVIFHNPFAFVPHGMFSDNKFLRCLFTGWENNCIEMWYIAIIICVQPQFAETSGPRVTAEIFNNNDREDFLSLRDSLGRLTNIKTEKRTLC